MLLHGRFCDTCTKGQVYFELEVRAVGGRARIVHAEEADHGALEAILDSQALRRM